MGRVPPVTLVTLALLALIFVAEVRMGALESRESIVAMGALARERVVAGEPWRLLTAPWLHGSVEHLVGNGIALYILGMVCEAAFGRAQLVVLYVLSGLGGSLVSVLLSPGPSVGASGAIFGLQGAAIVLLRLQRDRLLVRDRRVGFVLLIWAIYSIAGGLTDPYLDNGAHIGGALAGALIATPPAPGRARAAAGRARGRRAPLARARRRAARLRGRGLDSPLTRRCPAMMIEVPDSVSAAAVQSAARRPRRCL